MKLKTQKIDGIEYAIVTDGKPVYVDDTGADIAFDVVHTQGKIAQLNGEAKSHREAKEAAEAKLATFAGIEDPEAAKQALEVVSNLDQSKLIDAGKVEEIKAAATQAAKEQRDAAIIAKDAEYKPIVEERDALRVSLSDELIGGSFARSKWVGDNISVPSDMLQAQFARHFQVEKGKVVAKDTQGNQIFSRERPGDPAGFDEAIAILVDAYPNKKDIMVGRRQRGAGSDAPAGGGLGGEITEAEFNEMSPQQRAVEAEKTGFKLV